MKLLIYVVLILILGHITFPKVSSSICSKIKQIVDNKTFNKTFYISTLFFSLASLCIYFFVPLYALSFSESYLKEYGQVGDVIGGTTGPLIAIAASFLTFIAFWVQYKANKEQRNDISLERFESQFYEMLRLHRENLFDLSCGSYKGRDAMDGYCHKLMAIFILVEKLPMNFFRKEDLFIFEQYCKANYNNQYSKMISVISFNLFLYGGNFLNSFGLKSDERMLYSAIIKEIEAFESYCISYSSKVIYTDETVNDTLTDYVKLYFKESEKSHQSMNNLDGSLKLYVMPIGPKGIPKMLIPDSLLCGYNAKLGVYYRQLFQLVKFVSQREGLREDERYRYIKIVRSQLSDYEQILLYYNSLTRIGDKWNQVYNTPHVDVENKWITNMKLIARFRLIKNIPASFPMFGWTPESEYKSEISQYEAKHIHFFESK